MAACPTPTWRSADASSLPIVAEQIEPALALEPDLVTIYAGANDIMRPKVDLDAILAEYDRAVGRLAASGAHVVMFTPADPGGTRIYALVRDRFERYCAGVREIAARHGATLVDYWNLTDYRDPRLWDTDRMHMSPAGHQRMAIAVLDTLGVQHDLEPLVLADPSPMTFVERVKAQRALDHRVPRSVDQAPGDRSLQRRRSRPALRAI